MWLYRVKSDIYICEVFSLQVDQASRTETVLIVCDDLPSKRLVSTAKFCHHFIQTKDSMIQTELEQNRCVLSNI